MIKGYIGSYATSESEAVLEFLYDDKAGFSEVKPYLYSLDSKYLSLYQGDFVSLMKAERAGIALQRKGLNAMEVCLEEDITSCYVTQDENYIYTANYHEGHVLIYTKHKELSLYKKISIKEKAGCHQVLFYEHYMLVPCLLLDTIMVYDKEKDFVFVKEIPFPKGCGPRHGIFDSNGHFYVVSELSNQLFIFHVDKDMQTKQQAVVELLEEETQAACAALRMSKDERFLYISIRDINQIVVYDIEQNKIIQRISSGGEHPRDIALTPDERALFVLNRFSNNLHVFKRSAGQGTLTETDVSLHAVQGVSIVFAKEED